MASNSAPNLEVKLASGVSYFTPAQEPPAGTAADPQSDGAAVPKLFQPLKVRSLALHNRIAVRNSCFLPLSTTFVPSRNHRDFLEFIANFVPHY
jgi:hypothetical protein